MLARSVARSSTSARFAGTPASAPAARQLIRRMLAGCPRLDDCELVATEFIANAIRHSASGNEGGTFVLRILVGDDRVRIEVEDEGTCGRPAGWNRCAAPGTLPGRVGACDAPDDGRGLFLVQAIADETGHDPTDENGHVAWAELRWHTRLVRPAANFRTPAPVRTWSAGSAGRNELVQAGGRSNGHATSRRS
jgi:serine/threonine-protein kinase RsbW